MEIRMQAACFCVILLIGAYYNRTRHLKTRTTRCFRGILIAGMLNLIFDIASVCIMERTELVPALLRHISYSAFVISVSVTQALFLHYIFLLVEYGQEGRRISRNFIYIPMALNSLTALFFPVSDIREYAVSFGLPVILCSAIITYFILFSFIVAVRYRSKLPREKYIIIFLVLVILFMITGIQYLNPSLQLSSLGTMVTVLGIFLIGENPEDYFDKETQMFNEAGFCRMVWENRHTREVFHVVLFTISNMDSIREQYGLRTVQLCLRRVSDKIRMRFRHNTYALDDNELVFFAGSQAALENACKELEHWFLQPLMIEGEEIRLEKQIRPWTFCTRDNETESDILDAIENYFTTVLAKSVYMDHFCGVMNRNAFERDMAHLLPEKSEPQKFWISVLDINNLKLMNDSYGHGAGDALICGCAEILKEAVYEDSRIYRIGGDEFCVISIGKTKAQMDAFLTKLRFICGQMNEGAQYPVDFAVGTAAFDSKQDTSIYDTFSRGDKLMYEEKERMHKKLAKERKNDWDWVRKMDSLSFESLLFDAMCNISEHYLYMENEVTNMTHWSPNAVDEFELSGEYIFQGLKKWKSLINTEDRADYEEKIAQATLGGSSRFQCSYRIKNRWGEYVQVSDTGYMSRDEAGVPRLLVGLINEKESRGQRDMETGLFHKYEFDNRLERLCQGNAKSAGVLLFGINQFSKINTMYSYAVGDEVLKKTADILCGLCPVNSTQYRYGGDMFAVIYPHCDKNELCSLYEKIEGMLEELELSSGETVYLTISAGALMLKENMNADEVKNSLEHARAKVKKEAAYGIYYVSDPSLESSLSSLRVRELLRKCVKENMNGFYLNYQPICYGDGTGLYGCEALLRWSNPNCPSRGPEEFIPLLEESGLINEVGRWGISNALKQVKKWRAFKPDMTVNVNISYLQLRQEDFGQYIVEELRRQGLPPECLIIEMTESRKISNYDGVIEFVNYLKEYGISFALDDFGTGYSSFEALKNVQADWIKLEHTYVSSYRESMVDRNIIQSLIKLCHSLNIRVCAEGVEDEWCSKTMRDLKVEYLQGYYFSRPLSPEKFEEKFLTEREGT